MTTTIANLTGQQIRDRLDQDNWTLAKAIMEYRRQPAWSDEAFWSLAVWCRTRHQLAQWTGAE